MGVGGGEEVLWDTQQSNLTAWGRVMWEIYIFYLRALSKRYISYAAKVLLSI
jgi:hypothetical protein